MHKYFDPKNVISPKDCIDQVITLFDGKITSNPFSIAKITWQGKDGIGIRWNINEREWDDVEKKNGLKDCIGEPNSRGYPTWFILPDNFLSSLLSGDNPIAVSVRETLKGFEKREDISSNCKNTDN